MLRQNGLCLLTIFLRRLIALGCENKLTGIEMKGDTRPLYRMAAPQLLELPAVGSGKGINIEETAALDPDGHSSKTPGRKRGSI